MKIVKLVKLYKIYISNDLIELIKIQFMKLFCLKQFKKNTTDGGD